MPGKDRHNRSLHEAAHAVVALKFGLEIASVSVAKNQPHVRSRSASWRAKYLTVPERIRAYENDAIVALAGLAANRREYPDLVIMDVIFEDDDDDTINARSSVYNIVRLRRGDHVIPEGSSQVDLDVSTKAEMRDIYSRLVCETKELVDQHWPAIVRVAKHLESHVSADQAMVLDLIARAERLAR